MANPTNLLAQQRRYIDTFRRAQTWVDNGGPGRDIGRPMHVREIVREGLSDYWRLWRNLAAWVRPALPPNVGIEALVTDSKEANAWPFRHAFGADQHAVVVTHSTITRMQRLAAYVAQCTRAQPQCREDTLSAVFPEGHQASEDFDAFAQVIMQSAFLFLFNHELAHLLNGHGGCATSTDVLHWMAHKLDRPKRVRRTVEFDADASAFAWVLQYYQRFNGRPELLRALGPVRARVVAACMGSNQSRLTVTALGALVFHLALSNHAHARDGEHPSFRERVRLSRQACRTFEHGLQVHGSDADSAELALSVVVLDALLPAEDRILVGTPSPRNGDAEGKAEVKERPFFDQLRDALQAADADDDAKSDIARQREMAREMQLLRPQLKSNRILHALAPVDWWTDALALSPSAN